MRPHRRPAFTLIELIVTLGVVMLLIGIWLPAIAGAWNTAQDAKWSSIVRQGGLALQMYQNDWQSYPIAYENARTCTLTWSRVLVESGYAPNVQTLDPVLGDPERVPTVHLSMCVVVKASDLSPRPSIPEPLKSHAVRDDMISFPSLKGIVQRYWIDPTVSNPTTFCCKLPPWKVPVGMGDGSVIIGGWTEFTLDDDPLIVDNLYGTPVFSTWGGYLARDR